MQQDAEKSVGWKIARTALGGLLAVFLLFSVIASANPGLHQWLHQDSPGGGDVCVVCLLAHGQVNLPAIAAAFAVFVSACFVFIIRRQSPVPAFARHRLPQERGPPRQSRLQ